MFFKIIRPWEKGLIEHLGRYQRTIGSGMTFIIPFVQHVVRIDVREQVVDVPPQNVITKDNVVVDVDAVVYYQVVDPVKVTYNVADFYNAVTKLAQTNLRNLIGDLALDETLTSRELINSKLWGILDEATDEWGVKVTRVELQRIDPPKDVTEAMHRQMKAERERRARILEAEGLKQAAILEAEGSKQAWVHKAEGEAQAMREVAEAKKYERLTMAQGEAEAIKQIFTAIHEANPTTNLIAIRYLETLEKIADGQASKVFLPYEASGILSSLAGIGELWAEQRPTAANGHSKQRPNHRTKTTSLSPQEERARK
jgi:regulator of protease activity HflC (stomatin/prohibitin superfamily)